jgi:hypothetical protein
MASGIFRIDSIAFQAYLGNSILRSQIKNQEFLAGPSILLTHFNNISWSGSNTPSRES